MKHCYFVLPETISLQEYTKRKVILAVELHRDNPGDNESSDSTFTKNKV